MMPPPAVAWHVIRAGRSYNGFRIDPKEVRARPSGEGRMNFSINERRRGSLVILELNGRLVMGEGSEELDKEIQQRIQGGIHALVLDCAHVPAVDSQGIKSLVRGAISLQKRDGKMVLLHLTPRVRDVLELTRLLTVIEAFDDEDAAARSVSDL